MTLAAQYLSWIEHLGWVTRPMLTTLTRSTQPAKDKNLDKYLGRWQREGKVRCLRWGRRSIYYLPKYRTGRQLNTLHGVMSAQAVVWLWSQFPDRERLILSASDLAKESLGVVPDFGLAVKFSNGVHLFLIEFQTRVEAGRSTLAKVAVYEAQFENIKSRFHAMAVWVVVVVQRERLWVEQFARGVSQPFVYLTDSHAYFAESNLPFSPIFFTGRGELSTLLDT